jgi:hypothetical protein
VTTTSHRLAPLLHDALLVLVTGEPPRSNVFADEVVVESRYLSARDRCELFDRLGDRRGAFSDVELVVDRVEAGPVWVDVTWHFWATHSGPILVNEDELYEPTGRRVTGGGVTRFDVSDGCIWRVVFEPDDGTMRCSTGEQP